MKPFKDSKEELAFLSYVLGAEGITFPKGWTTTEEAIMNAFNYDIPFGYIGSPIISDAHTNNILMIVEQPSTFSIRVGPSNPPITLNPYPDIPVKLLEIENYHGNLKMSPKERIVKLEGIIEESLKDKESIQSTIDELRQNAKSLHSELYATRKKDRRVQKLNESGGFDVVSRGAEGLAKEIETITGARSKIAKQGAYSDTKLEEIAEFLGAYIQDFSEQPFRKAALDVKTVNEYRRSWKENMKDM